MPTSLRNAFLTPETLGGQPACKQLALPVDLLRYAYGALAPLANVDNWEKYGAIEPDAAAEYFDDWLYSLVEDSCLERPEILTAQMESSTSIAHNTEIANYWSQASSSKSAVMTSDLLTGKFTIVVESIITVSYTLVWANNGTGFRDGRLRHNGTWLTLSRTKADNSFVQTTGESISILAAAGDEISIGAYQNSGAALNLVVSGTLKPKLTIVAFPR